MRRAFAILLLAASVRAADLPAAAPEIEIVATSDIAFMYRERIPLRVAADPARGVFHRKGCPAVTPRMQWIAPAAATLRGLRAHACVAAAEPEYAMRSEQRQPRDPNVISVLFLGNSLTYFDEIPRMTAAIAAKEARPLRVDAVTRSGATLEQLWISTDAPKRIWRDHWDYVIIQGGAGSAGPLHNSAYFNRYLHRFANEVRTSGAKPLFYMVWSLTHPEEHEAASIQAADAAEVRIIPVGTAWNDLLRHGAFRRLDWDEVHPDAFGAYLVACTVYSTIYNRAAPEAPYDFRSLADRYESYDAPLRDQKVTETQARAIRNAAWLAVATRANKP